MYILYICTYIMHVGIAYCRYRCRVRLHGGERSQDIPSPPRSVRSPSGDHGLNIGFSRSDQENQEPKKDPTIQASGGYPYLARFRV